MPYQVKKVGSKYKLWNIKQKKYVNKNFNSKDSAISAGKNYMKYRKEKPVVKGNKILNKNKI
jgi:hypothetical protein